MQKSWPKTMDLEADFEKQIRRKEMMMPGVVCEGEARFKTEKKISEVLSWKYSTEI